MEATIQDIQDLDLIPSINKELTNYAGANACISSDTLAEILDKNYTFSKIKIIKRHLLVSGMVTYCDNVIITKYYPFTISISNTGFEPIEIILYQSADITRLLIELELRKLVSELACLSFEDKSPIFDKSKDLLIF